MIRSTLEYGAFVWDPHLVKDIKCLERVQKKGNRFITGDYHTRIPGSITEMLATEKLQPLQERRHLRLAFLFKIIEGKVPAIAPEDFHKPKPARRKVRATQFKDHVTTNIITNQAHHNSKPYIVSHSTTEEYSHSFFVQTVLEWNHLEDVTISSNSVEAFRLRLAPTSY